MTDLKMVTDHLQQNQSVRIAHLGPLSQLQDERLLGQLRVLLCSTQGFTLSC